MIEASTALLVPKHIISPHKSGNLGDYVETFNDTHVILSMGYLQILNHASKNDGIMLSKHLHPEVDFEEYTEKSLDVVAVSNWYIFPGDQIFSHYGILNENKPF